MMLPIVLLSAIMLAFVQNSLGNDEDGYYDPWRKALCESGDQEMLKKFEECFLLSDKEVLDVDWECAKKTYPDSEGEGVKFLNAACQDISLFKKFDECFEEYKTDPDFVKKMELSDEAIECNKRVIEEYREIEFNIESLLNYFKDHSSKSK